MRMKLVLCTAVLLLASPALADTVFGYFNPAVKVANVGDIFTIDIVADMTNPIVGWGLDLTVTDPMYANRTATDPVIGPDWDPAFAPDLDGLAGLAFPVGVSGPGILLATVEFQALALGTTNLVLSVTPGDLTEGFALYPSGFDNYEFSLGTINVVPEPAALALLALGALIRRR